jgi:hypothetical protein
MRIFILRCAGAALLVSSLAGSAIAADKATDRFAYQVRSAAAWQGIEVNRVVLDGERVRAHGTKGDGRQVVFERNCGDDGIVCPRTLDAKADEAASSGSAEATRLAEGFDQAKSGR